MLEAAFIQQLELAFLDRLLCVLGTTRFVNGAADALGILLISTGTVGESMSEGKEKLATWLVATNYLFALGPSRSMMGAIRRVTSLLREYREPC
jgi:hypothetical protein